MEDRRCSVRIRPRVETRLNPITARGMDGHLKAILRSPSNQVAPSGLLLVVDRADRNLYSWTAANHRPRPGPGRLCWRRIALLRHAQYAPTNLDGRFREQVQVETGETLRPAQVYRGCALGVSRAALVLLD